MEPNAQQQISEIMSKLAWDGFNTELAELLEVGADPNGRDAEGIAPLVTACHAGNVIGVHLLLDAGADPTVRYGELDIPALALCANKQTAQALIDYGASIWSVDRRGGDCGKTAQANGRAEVKTLIDERAMRRETLAAARQAQTQSPNLDRSMSS